MSASLIIRQTRHRTGLTQAELAVRSGIARTVISDYERGRREPSVTALERLLAAAGLRLAVESAHTEEETARLLEQVLDLAELLPHDRVAPLPPSPFPRRSAS